MAGPACLDGMALAKKIDSRSINLGLGGIVCNKTPTM